MNFNSKMNVKRILIKISGEALKGDTEFGFNYQTISKICKDVIRLHEKYEVVIVVGGGNLFRGIDSNKCNFYINPAIADFIGMNATVMNSLILQSALENFGVQSRVLSAFAIEKMCQTFDVRKGLQQIKKGRIVICAGGTGNPFFSTDTAAVLRACELECDLLLKATQVDGVYDKDPNKFSDAKRFDSINYNFIINNKLKVMDSTAVTLAQEKNLPMLVFKLHGDNSICDVMNGKNNFTLIGDFNNE